MIGATEIKSKSVLSKNNRQGSQGYVDIKKKSKEELEELIERQNKLLLNRCFTQKLPDKGEKLISFKIQLENELKKREESDATCNLLNKLTLNDPNDIEWNQGKSKTNLNYEKHLDSDDEDYDDESVQVDPLKLLATHSGTVNRGKIIHRGSTCLNGAQKLCYVDKFCEKYGEVSKTKERFKPNQLKNNVKDQFVTSAEKVKQKFGDKWEVTQATPPIPVFKDTVMISLSESLNLQKQQAQKLKEIERTYATERLLQSIGVKMGDKLPVINVNKYRKQTDNFDETIESDEEGCKDSETENEENNLIFPGETQES